MVTDLLSGDKKISFFPIWQDKDEQNTDGLENPTEAKKETECAFIEITVKDVDNKDVKVKLHYLDLYGFIYMIGNEELRRQLALRYERQIVYMPYEVTFKIDEAEKKEGVARRRIELPIDEVAMAMVRARAQLLEGKSPVESAEELQYWREKKISNLDEQIKEKYEKREEGNEEAGKEGEEKGEEIII